MSNCILFYEGSKLLVLLYIGAHHYTPAYENMEATVCYIKSRLSVPTYYHVCCLPCMVEVDLLYYSWEQV